jgi:hypothetical protein
MFNLRRIAVTTATAAAVTAAIAVAGAGPAAAAYSAVESCTGVSGTISYSPGLTSTAKTQQAVLVATLTGCSGAYTGAQAGSGTVTAVMTGTSKVGSVVETGNATISWPASSGLNPTNAKITIRESAAGGVILLSGPATSGAFASSVISTSLLPYANTGTGTKAHPLKTQSVLNTVPFAAKVNFG